VCDESSGGPHAPRRPSREAITSELAFDFFCGRGGWARGLIDAGYRVIGWDLEDMSKWYPGEFVQADVQDLRGADLLANWGWPRVCVASPPCTEFSTLTNLAYIRGWRGPRDPEKGMVLVREARRIISECWPKYWVIENVKYSRPYISAELGAPVFDGTPWPLWGNFPGFLRPTSNRLYKLPLHGTPRRIVKADGSVFIDRRNRSGGHGKFGSAARATVPYFLARGVADACLPEGSPSPSRARKEGP
jgi:C-5 cytosine-specific DNA methylase